MGQTTAQGTQNGKGTASLVIGIIAILLCGGGVILPILAITFGWTGSVLVSIMTEFGKLDRARAEARRKRE